MRRYETIFITLADLSEEDIVSLVERLSAIIKDRKGAVIKIEKWGKRKLAYEIVKQSRGFYVLIDFAGGSAIVTELERNLRIDDKVLKYMTVKTRESFNLQDIEKEMTPEIVEAKAEQTPPSDQEKPAIQENAGVVEAEASADKKSDESSPEPAVKEEKE